MTSGEVPLLVIVSVCTVLQLPGATTPNVKLVGFIVIPTVPPVTVRGN